MRDIRKRSEKSDNMFDPLKDTVSLLSNYGVSFTEKVNKHDLRFCYINALIDN